MCIDIYIYQSIFLFIYSHHLKILIAVAISWRPPWPLPLLLWLRGAHLENIISSSSADHRRLSLKSCTSTSLVSGPSIVIFDDFLGWVTRLHRVALPGFASGGC